MCLMVCGLSSLPLQASNLPFFCQKKTVSTALTLDSAKTALFIIHNQSKTPIWLVHPSDGKGASAGWDSKLTPDHYSALKVEKRNLKFNCMEISPGHEQQVPCHKVVNICEANGDFKQTETGSFWVAENLKPRQLTYSLVERGGTLKQIGED